MDKKNNSYEKGYTAGMVCGILIGLWFNPAYRNSLIYKIGVAIAVAYFLGMGLLLLYLWRDGRKYKKKPD